MGGDEEEILAAPGFDLGMQIAAGAASGRNGQQVIEFAVGLGMILSEGRVVEFISSSTDADSPAQQVPKFGRGGFVAVVDGILDVAQHMRQADLVIAGEFFAVRHNDRRSRHQADARPKHSRPRIWPGEKRFHAERLGR